MLDLSPPLPTTLGVLSKWAAESVRHLYIPASTFIANTKGYPVLPKPTQECIRNNMIASLLYRLNLAVSNSNSSVSINRRSYCPRQTLDCTVGEVNPHICSISGIWKGRVLLCRLRNRRVQWKILHRVIRIICRLPSKSVHAIYLIPKNAAKLDSKSSHSWTIY